MPYQVSVGSQVVEFPDSVSQEEAQKILADKFPTTGQDIANALQDPNFTPTQEQYQLFEDYNKTRQTDWLQSLLTAADTVVQTAGAAGKAAVTTGAAFNPKNYVEGLAQGTAQLYGLVAQSQDPDSALFKLNNLISGTGTLENRYGQFLEARQFNKDLDAYAKGDMSIMFKPEDLNPEFVQGVAMVADPTMFVPGVGQLLGAEKVAAKAVGKAAAVAGKGVQAISKPVERLSAAAGKFVTEATGISPEALRGAATTSGVLAATGVGPAIGAVGAVPFIAEAATDVGRALETAGAQMGRAPTRIGALEAVGAIPEANMRQRIIGTIGRYGGDAALRTALAGTAGTLEGAALGGALGYLSGGEEGAASGIGSGGVAGALGSLGARGLQTLTGSEAKAARLNDLTTYVDTLAPEKKAAYQSVQERFGTDTAANLMDLESLIKGTRGDIGVEILRGDEFQKRAGVTARGVVPDENATTPRILINVDAMPKVKGDSPIYTLGHELLHALAKTKQFQGDVTGFVETLTGAYVPNPDGTVRLVSEGQYSPAKVEQLFNDYVKQLPEDARANVISANPTASDRAVYVGEELAAEQVGRILSSQKPDAFLRGFGSTRQNFTDMLLLQEASRVGSKIGQLIERTFGITPTDSVLFPEIKNASPALDAALRRLLKARENIDEALLNADYQKSFKIDQKAITDPVAADYAVRGGFAERLPTGEVRLLTNGELLQRETRDVTALKQIIDGLPGAKIDINGEVVGDLSPEQLDAIKGSSVSSQMQQRVEMVNRGINEGRALHIEYYPATEKVQDPTSKRWRTKYASRRVTFREALPYNLLLSKENNAYVRVIDLTQVRKSLQRSIRPDGSVGGLWGNVGEFLGELNAYLTNLDRKENAIPSRKIFGPDKAEFFGNFMNSAEKGGSEFIHSFRLDRMGQMDPSDFRAKFSESAYKKMKDRFMPAGSVGEEQAWKSGAGFTILTSGNKFRLYGPEGKLLGIYDSAEQAQRKANATQTRLLTENDQLKYPTRDEVRQTAEAGNRNRALDRTQSGPEGGQVNRQVRQAGDVTERFDTLVRSAPEARFMPIESQPENAPVSGRLSDGQKQSIDEISAYYASQTPRRVEILRNDAVDSLASRLVNKGIPVQEANKIALKTFQKARKGVSGALQVISGLGLSDLSRMAGTGKPTVERRAHINPNWMTSAFEAFATDEGLALMKAQQVATQLSKADQAKVAAGQDVEAAKASGVRQSSMQQGMEFVRGEMNADRKAFGSSLREDPNSPPRVYASVVEGQKFGSQGNYNVFFEWKTETPMVVTSHHHYGVANGVTGIHAQGNVGDKNARSFGNPSAEQYDTLPSGKQILNTHLLVGNAGVPDARAHQLTVSIPESSLSNVRKIYKERGTAGVEAELNKIAVSQMVGSASQGKTFSYTTKEGIPPMVAIQRNRTEAYVLNPDLANVASVTIVSNSPKEVSLIKKNLEKAFQNNGTSLPKVKVVSAESGPSKNVGRKAITDEYFKLTGEQRFMPSDAEYLSAVEAGDTAKAQELVDQAAKAAGYTVGPVWHGTSSEKEILQFKTNIQGPATGNDLPGAYFTENKAYASAMGSLRAKDFKGIVKPYYLRIENLASADDLANALYKVEDQSSRVNRKTEHRGSDGVKYLLRKREGKEARNILEKQGFTGAFRKGATSDEWIAFDPSQIKSADPVTRDDSGNIIPLSQRFQSTSPDIRYMPAPVPDPSIPGAYSMSGYRILPGKTKSKFRVYSPDGSLAGVVGSVDDAQRMIQKKLQ